MLTLDVQRDQLNWLTTFTYNPVNLRLTRQDARGYTTNYSYDALNRPSGRAYPDGSLVTFTYDAASQLLEMQDTSGNSIYTYDLDGRPASFTAPVSGVQLAYSYDPVGNRVGMTEVGSGLSPQTYAYDPAGNLTRLTDPFGQVTTFTYDRLERELQHLSATPEILTTHAYDPAGRETVRTVFTVPDEGPPVASYDATYDSVGNRLTVDTYPEYDWQYTYDPANQLKTELVPAAGDYSVSYTYDPAGNRNTLSKLVLPASRTVTTYSYDAANELTLVQPQTGSPTTNTFDLNGNLLTQHVGSALTTYTWDYENRLTSIALSPGVTYPHGTIVTSIYDANGLRQAYQDSTGRSTFTYDGQNIWRADQPSATTNRCIQLPGVYGPLLARQQTIAGDTTHVYALGDLSDNVGMMYGGNSNLFTAFGNNLLSPGTGLFAFVGMLGYFIDPTTGLYYVRGRWYDPVTGRFVSADPIGFGGGNWDNLYPYVGNNPVNWTDPSGLACLMIDYSAARCSGAVNPTGICHAYILFGTPCNLSTSAGFWANVPGCTHQPCQAQGGGMYPGQVVMPDPDSGSGTCVLENYYDDFEDALCNCVLKSKAHPPMYKLPPHGLYTCVNWAYAMWDCANSSLPPPPTQPSQPPQPANCCCICGSNSRRSDCDCENPPQGCGIISFCPCPR